MADEPDTARGSLHSAAADPATVRASLNLQGTLFDDLPPAQRPGGEAESIGYRGPTACSAAGITYRQLDYWARTNLVEPSVREASGSGSQRLYAFRDILVLRIVKKLLDAGVSLQNIRTAIATLHDRGAEDLAQITLISDGTTVYECTSSDEVVDLLQGGQAVFAIAVGRQVRDVEGTLAHLPGERARPGEAATGGESDELATRRRKRTTA
ncbi:MAG TPA: MerR family transcriptional regulator [Mycobacteriales bacterium]|nr:MerR family transcriptional regulator [Mycobacteriales bacterium]